MGGEPPGEPKFECLVLSAEFRVRSSSAEISRHCSPKTAVSPIAIRCRFGLGGNLALPIFPNGKVTHYALRITAHGLISATKLLALSFMRQTEQTSAVVGVPQRAQGRNSGSGNFSSNSG